MKVLCYFKEGLARGHECLLGEPTEAQLEQLARCAYDAEKAVTAAEMISKVPPWSAVRSTFRELVSKWIKGDTATAKGFQEARRAVMTLAEQEVGPLVPRITDTYDMMLPEEAAKEFVEEWEDDTDHPVLVVVRPLDDEARALDCWKGEGKRPFLVVRAVAHVEVTWSASEAVGEEAALP